MNECDKKIFNLTHNDADGLASAIVLKNFYNSVEVKTVSYSKMKSEVDTLTEVFGNIKKISALNYDCIYITDLNMDYDMVSKIKSLGIPVIYLDHHSSNKEVMNNPEDNMIVYEGCCGAMLVKEYLENKHNAVFSESISNYIKYINDYDMWIHKEKLSKPLQYVFDYYHQENLSYFYITRFINGFSSEDDFFPSEADFIIRKIQAIEAIYESLEIHDLKHRGMCLIKTTYPMINEMCDRLLTEYEDINIVFCLFEEDGKRCSIRTNLNNIDLGSAVKELDMGGGHAKACGINVNAKNPEDKIEILNLVSDYLVKKYNFLG